MCVIALALTTFAALTGRSRRATGSFGSAASLTGFNAPRPLCRGRDRGGPRRLRGGSYGAHERPCRPPNRNVRGHDDNEPTCAHRTVNDAVGASARPAGSGPAPAAVARPAPNAPRAVPKSVLSEHPVHAGLPKRVLNAPKAPFGEMLSEHSAGLYRSRRPRPSPKSRVVWVRSRPYDAASSSA